MLRNIPKALWFHKLFIVSHQTSTHENYPGTASIPIRAYRPNGRQCRRKADLDFLAFCVLEETTGTTADDLDEDGVDTAHFHSFVNIPCNTEDRPQRTVRDDVRIPSNVNA